MGTDAKSKCKKRARSAETEKVLELLRVGVAGTEIAKRLDCKPSRVYAIKNYYKTELEQAKVLNKQLDISNYGDDVEKVLKSNILRLGNTIHNYNIQKASLSQLTTAFGIMYDKLRLHQGKSTANIATQLSSALTDEQEAIVRASIKSLKKSMLTNT